MKKRITPKQVENGEVVYTFESFLGDLWEDVKSTISQEYPDKMSENAQRDKRHREALKEVFTFVYRLCYLAATNQPELKSRLEKTDDKNKDVMLKTLKSNKENIALLRAIFMRKISSKLKQGLTKRQAVKATIAESKNAFYKLDELRKWSTNGKKSHTTE